MCLSDWFIIKKLMFMFVVFCFACSIAAHATSSGMNIRGTGLLVAPTRLVFEGRSRGSELTLVNRGTRASTYRLALENHRMTSDGSREQVEPGEELDGELFADKYVRFAPRQVRLEPGEQQTVRVIPRLPPDLSEAEYRTQLAFRWIPEADELESSEDLTDNSSDQMQIRIDVAYGISVPIIIRNGDLKAEANISNSQVITENDRKIVTLRLNRKGNRSLYGDFHIYDSDNNELLHRRRGVAVYTPNEYRDFRIRLPENIVNFNTLRVEYRLTDNEGGNLLADSIVQAPEK